MIFVITSSSVCDQVKHTLSTESFRIGRWGYGPRQSKGRNGVWTHLHVFEAVLLTNTPQHILLAALLQFPREEQLVQNEVGFLEIEDDVQLADIPIVFVHLFDVAVDDLEGDELVVSGVAAGDEEKRGVSAVNNLSI